MSFHRSEIRSDQRITEQTKNLVGLLQRLSHGDFTPMFTYLPMGHSQRFAAPPSCSPSSPRSWKRRFVPYASGQTRLHRSPRNCAVLPPSSACMAYPLLSTKTTENVWSPSRRRIGRKTSRPA